jgi:hypothetical protein
MAWTPREEKVRQSTLNAAAAQGCHDARIEDMVLRHDDSYEVKLGSTVAGQPSRLVAHVEAFPDDGMPPPARCVVLV